MKKLEISGSPRENVGTKESKILRREGNIPAVLYGGNGNTHFFVDKKAVSKAIFTPDVFEMVITVGDKKASAIIKDVQFHPVTDEILHIDFMEMVPGKAIKVKLPIRISGTAPGVLNGGKMMIHFRKVDIKGTPEQLPEFINVDISKLRIGMSVRIKDLVTDELQFLNDHQAVVVQVRTARGAVADSDDEEEEAEGAEAPAEAAAEA